MRLPVRSALQLPQRIGGKLTLVTADDHDSPLYPISETYRQLDADERAIEAHIAVCQKQLALLRAAKRITRKKGDRMRRADSWARSHGVHYEAPWDYNEASAEAYARSIFEQIAATRQQIQHAPVVLVEENAAPTTKQENEQLAPATQVGAT